MSGRAPTLVQQATDAVVEFFAVMAPVMGTLVLILSSMVLATTAMWVSDGHAPDSTLIASALGAIVLIPIAGSSVLRPLWQWVHRSASGMQQRVHIRRRLRTPEWVWGPESKPPARPPPAPLEDRMAVLHRRWPRRELAEQWTGDGVRFELARAAWSLRGWLAGRHRLPVRITAHELAVGNERFAVGEIRRVRLEGQRIVVHRIGERAWKSPRLLFADRTRVAELLRRLDHSDAEIQEQSRAARAVRAALEPLRHLHK